MAGMLAASGRDLFASEIREARNLGLRLDIKTDDHVAFARLTPTTPKATVRCLAAAAAAGHPGDRAVEARCPFTSAREVPEALAMAIAAALTLARDAMA